MIIFTSDKTIVAMMKMLGGIIPPLPTSFHTNEYLYPEKISENIRKLLEYELSGILVLGSNGELVMLTDEEKAKVFETARQAIPADRLMIAGTGGQSTRETISLTALAADKGADAALVLNPFYYKGLMSQDVLVQHYHEVADYAEIPVLIYNMPVNSGIDMDAATILEIAEHPNVVGLKDSSGDMDKMKEVILKADKEFRVFTGGAGTLFKSLEIGAVGGILAMANIFPQKCLDIMKLFIQGDMDKAREIQESIITLNTTVTRKFGVPALKAAMDQLGLYGGVARKPLLPLDETKSQELLGLLKLFS